PELASLSGLDNLNSIGGNLRIYDNDALASLSGLDNLTSIGGGLSVWSNDAITSIAGLEGLTSIAGDIHISGNGSLSTCEVQWLCDYLSSPNGSVDIFGNATGCNSPTEVANACGITLQCLPFGNYHFFSQDDIDNFQNNYPNCTEIEGNVTLEGSDIVNLNGLSIVTSIGGNLDIYANAALTSMSGLDNLDSIGGNLQIYANAALTSLSGLENIEATSITDLYIGYNSSLSTCEVQCICDYLLAPNGSIGIYSNAPGCNNPEEVEEACMATGEEEFKVLSAKFKVEVFPNPFSEIVHIEYEIKNPSPVEIQVFNTLGERVAVVSDGISTEGKHVIIWNAVNLPPGLYFARVIVGEESAGVKLIKP
ncbi:MAG: T9SS type A sorting domain-containing protein, partial [Bacteroidales bacterium]|nr:T9SS type A sorting domain-containing protein [Bacteroidales bacterium]